jgi:hypothetical protein
MGEIIEILSKCSFSWQYLKEMKETNVEFFAGDGFKRLRIIDFNEKERSIHMIDQLGKITWPLKYQKLEEVHNKIHSGEIDLLSYEIDKLVPTWGNYITGLFKYLGCDKV